jgi:WD40 repeat protein
MEGHTYSVSSVCYSPDGTRIVSGSDDKTVRVWDAISGSELLKMEGHTDSVYSVCYSPDGTRIVSGSRDNTVRVWDAVSGSELLKKEGHTYTVSSVCYSPDGTRIVSGSVDKTVRVWDAISGSELLKMEGHTYTVTSVCYSPDGTRIVSGSNDNTVRVWDAVSGSQILQIVGFMELKNKVDRNSFLWVIILFLMFMFGIGMSIVFPNGGLETALLHLFGTFGFLLLASTIHSSSLRVKFVPGFSILSICYSPDGTHIVSCSGDNRLHIWDAVSGSELLMLNDLTDGVLSVCYSPDGTRIVSGIGNTLQVWDNLLSRLDSIFVSNVWQWVKNQNTLPNIFSLIFRSEEHAKGYFVKGTEEFWKREHLEISAKSLIENQNTTALLNLVRGLDSIEILQNHLYLIGTLQTLEKPVPQNLETFVSDPTVVRWINTVLEHPFCKFMILMDGILQIAHMFCFGYASYYFQDIEGSYSDISNNPRHSSNEFIPIIWTLFVITTYFTSFEIYQGYSMYQLGLFSSWAIDFWNFVDVGCMICSYTLFGYALYESSRSSYEYRVVASIGALCLWIRLLGYMKIFNIRLATFVLSLFQVFADLKSFSIILIAFFVMFTQAFFILANSKDSVSDVEEFSSIKNIFFMLFGMLLGEYYLEEFDHSWLLLALKIFFMFLMTIIMLNILIAVVSDSYENAITRARKIYLRALFQLTANHVLLFEYILSQRFDKPTLEKTMDYFDQWVSSSWDKTGAALVEWIEQQNFNPLLYIFFNLIAVCIFLVYVVIYIFFFILCLPLCCPVIFMFHLLKDVHLLNVSSMLEDENDNEWLGRVLDMERRLDKIVKSSQEVQMETSVSQIKELRSQMENQNKELRNQMENQNRELKCQMEIQNTQLKVQNKELTSKVEALESKLDLLLEAIKNPSS